MADIEVHDGVTNRRFHVDSLDEPIEVYLRENRIVVPPDYDVERRQSPPSSDE
ncbi:MAG: hypothetical protein ABEJ58_04845 [Halodesulfurarchaeum sp.]